MKLKKKDIVVKYGLIESSKLRDEDEAFKDISTKEKFIKQHKIGDKYFMVWEDEWNEFVMYKISK